MRRPLNTAVPRSGSGLTGGTRWQPERSPQHNPSPQTATTCLKQHAGPEIQQYILFETEDMLPGTHFPLPPTAYAPPEVATPEATHSRWDEPPRTHTVPGELHQIRAYVEATNTRIQYLEELLEPWTVGQVTEIKRGMKDTHRGLEKRRLVDLEAKLRGTNSSRQVSSESQGQRPVSYVPSGAARILEKATQRVDVDDEDHGGHGDDRYLMSGALAETSWLEVEDESSSPLPSASSRNDEEHDDEVTALPALPLPVEAYRRSHLERLAHRREKGVSTGSDAVLESLRQKKPLDQRLAKTRVEVEESIETEEIFNALELHAPDRQRDGSTTGFFATFCIISGIDDPSFLLPKLAFLKIHEVKKLKKWLVDHKYLHPSGDISRIEKLLHLLFLLQEGCRMETIAVIFSRTPREVKAACKEVFEGLLQLHSETMLPGRDPPACKNLWKISRKYFMSEEERKKAEVYYEWANGDIVKVLATLNLYIGRYRQQGRFALQGPFLEWWRHFEDFDKS